MSYEFRVESLGVETQDSQFKTLNSKLSTHRIMEIRIAEDIKELIYDHGSVVIPGLGSFTGDYKSASIDNVLGHLAPPALDIVFNPNNVLNDGVLLDYIKNKYHVLTHEGQKAIDTFTEDVVQTFKKHEIVVIPDVGRLYRDYSDKVRFLPENTNFNTDTFGLPTVQFYPVSRNKPDPILEKTETVVATQKYQPEVVATKPLVFPDSADNISTPLIPEHPLDLNLPFEIRKFIPALAVALLLILAFSIYLFTKSDTNAVVERQKLKVNEKPPKVENNVGNGGKQPTQQTPSTQNPSKPQDIASDKSFKNTPTVTNPPINSENSVGAVASKPQNQAVLIIGGFSNKINIKRLKTWISNNGYGIYERKSGGLTVIGAEVNYNSKKDLNNILNRFRNRFGDEVEVMRK